MEDKFKFRFWNNRNMIYDDIPNLGLYNCDDYKWMQCTGLKDKNGKLIFEGDILRGDSETSRILGKSAKNNRTKTLNWIVNWSFNIFWGGWNLKAIGEMNRTFPNFIETEIIGNIYENPELLGGKK